MKRNSLILFAVFIIMGCGLMAPDEDVISREGEPDVHLVESEDEEMNAARKTVQETIDEFIRFLESPEEGQTYFSLKARFIVLDRPGSFEHIWLDDVSFDGERFTGKIGNEPLDVTYLSLGEEVTVEMEDVSDWMIIEEGVLKGGYTLLVLINRMSQEEREEFLQQLDFSIPGY